jgi:hypothetical protein
VWCDETTVRGDGDGSCRFPPSILRSRGVNGTPKRKIAITRRITATMTPICWCIRVINDSDNRSSATRTYNEKVNPADPNLGRNRGAVPRRSFG